MLNFCVQHAIHIINRPPTPLLNFKCSYDILYNQLPSIIHLKVFGYLSFTATIQSHITKFDPKARKDVFLWFKDGTKEYILYDLQHNNIFASIHVVFYENHFPFKLNQSPSNSKHIQCNLPIYDNPNIVH